MHKYYRTNYFYKAYHRIFLSLSLLATQRESLTSRIREYIFYMKDSRDCTRSKICPCEHLLHSLQRVGLRIILPTYLLCILALAVFALFLIIAAKVSNTFLPCSMVVPGAIPLKEQTKLTRIRENSFSIIWGSEKDSNVCLAKSEHLTTMKSSSLVPLLLLPIIIMRYDNRCVTFSAHFSTPFCLLYLLHSVIRLQTEVHYSSLSVCQTIIPA